MKHAAADVYGDEYNHVWLYDEVSHESVEQVVADLRRYDEVKYVSVGDVRLRVDVRPVALHIHSPGGDLDAMLSLLNYLARTRLDVVMVADGMAASAAAVLLAAGKPGCRFASRHARVLLHQHRVTGLSLHKPDDDVQADAAESAGWLESQVEILLAARLKATRDQIVALLRRDVWMSAEQALRLGLVDGIADDVPVKAVRAALEGLPKLLFADSKLDISRGTNEVIFPPQWRSGFTECLPVARLLRAVNAVASCGMPACRPRPVLLRVGLDVPLDSFGAVRTAIAQSLVPVVGFVDSHCSGGALLVSMLCHHMSSSAVVLKVPMPTGEGEGFAAEAP